MQLALWSPNTHTATLALVVNNSLYSVEDPNWDKLVKVGPMPEEGVRQGMADFLYQEKIWHSQTGLWFSPSGDWLAFATFQPSTGDKTCEKMCKELPQVG